MTVEPKLIDATELEEMRQDSSGEFLWSADSARALLSHIAAQDRRIAELEAERWSLMTQLSGANRSLRENGIDPYAGLP